MTILQHKIELINFNELNFIRDSEGTEIKFDESHYVGPKEGMRKSKTNIVKSCSALEIAALNLQNAVFEKTPKYIPFGKAKGGSFKQKLRKGKR
jgi:hypothetical protein